MNEARDNSSLPLLLSISGAVVAVAVGGWFFLDQEISAPAAGQVTPIVMSSISAITSTEATALENTEAAVEIEPESDTATAPGEKSSTDVGAELRKARLAADADVLIFPPAQSALYYYGRVLSTDPRHAIAMAELDAVLSRVAQSVTGYLDDGKFDDAYEIAVLVAKQKPEHELVVKTQQTLDDRTERLVGQAIKHAQDGNDDQSVQALAAAEKLPGRNSDYFTAIRESIAEIRSVRLAAQRDKTRRSRLVANDARAAWVDSVQNAIEQGNLISPVGASAVHLLAEKNDWAAERAQLTDEILAALVDTAQSYISSQRLNDAEDLLGIAEILSGGPDGLVEIRAALDRAFVETKSNRAVPMSELVQIKSGPPKYPQRAMRRNLTGWVELFFTVTPSGDTADIEVHRSEPETVFDDAAIEAIAEWEFQPVEYRGQLISQRTGTKLVFRIE